MEGGNHMKRALSDKRTAHIHAKQETIKKLPVMNNYADRYMINR